MKEPYNLVPGLLVVLIYCAASHYKLDRKLGLESDDKYANILLKIK